MALNTLGQYEHNNEVPALPLTVRPSRLPRAHVRSFMARLHGPSEMHACALQPVFHVLYVAIMAGCGADARARITEVLCLPLPCPCPCPCRCPCPSPGALVRLWSRMLRACIYTRVCMHFSPECKCLCARVRAFVSCVHAWLCVRLCVSVHAWVVACIAVLTCPVCVCTGVFACADMQSACACVRACVRACSLGCART